MSANSLRKPFKVPFKTPQSNSGVVKVQPQPNVGGVCTVSPPIQSASVDNERADVVEVVEISDEDHESKHELHDEIHEVSGQPTIDRTPSFGSLSKQTLRI